MTRNLHARVIRKTVTSMLNSEFQVIYTRESYVKE